MIFLPTLHTFAMNNVFTGSCGLLRFKLTPSVELSANGKEVIMEHSSIRGELWHGILCYEKSEIEEERTFPMSEEGRSELLQWLENAVPLGQDAP